MYQSVTGSADILKGTGGLKGRSVIETEASHGFGRGSGDMARKCGQNIRSASILVAHGSRPINKAMLANGKNEKSPLKIIPRLDHTRNDPTNDNAPSDEGRGIVGLAVYAAGRS